MAEPSSTSSALEREERVLAPGYTYHDVTEKIGSIVLIRPTGKLWLLGFAIAFLFVMILNVAVLHLFVRGVGIWGINIPVAWGFAIVNFVWWIGIGHAGTLISAILLLLHQEWRTSINRFAEAMTLFAVACAGLFPLLHLGRPWFAYWLLPYPNVMNLWPQFRSPLIWDVFAVSTYFTISLVFWYVGLIPDFATLRDRAQGRISRVIYAILAMGWRGASRHWHRYDVAYVLLAGLATPLVVSVHTVVSFDFAVAQLPGWHSTIFPPYFVAGAIYSGFAMVLTLVIPVRWAFGLQGFITRRHLDAMGKFLLLTGLIVGYGYLMENFIAYYSGDVHEMTQITQRQFTGPYIWIFWLVIACNVLIVQFMWLKKVRTTAWMLFLVACGIQLGMWMERFMIIITSLNRNFIPSKWANYAPTIWDYATLFGTIGLFLALMFLFVRFVPMISMFEMRSLVARTSGTPEPAPSMEEEGRVSD
ncbi:MAG TPA: NrfD/PsrC family molybdoenzyme membrane anchor subunit [Tepidisphaeraceae bacterium]|nr:NrfD/PsrC family molybdoenzyme membrane anchor subunit [Tepidisphaeraceae bacterium]